MERNLSFPSNNDLQILFGKYDQNLRTIEKELNVRISRHENGIKVSGSKREDVDKACGLFDYLQSIVAKGSDVKPRDITYAIKLATSGQDLDFQKLAKENIEVQVKGILVSPKTKGQIDYVEAIKHFDIVFGVGPAGTGKT
jgi:phosphate starvation-inducible protein PhoH and related proteins